MTVATINPALLERIPESVVARVAYILGESCAAADCLREAASRRATGQKIAFYRHGNMWIVGPEQPQSSGDTGCGMREE